MIYIFLKIAKIHYSCIRLCTKFCLNLRELFLRENVSPRKKRKKRTEICFSPRKKKKKDASHRERRKKKNASQKEANRKISGEFDDKDTSDSECKARMTQITSSIFNFQFAIFPRCR